MRVRQVVNVDLLGTYWSWRELVRDKGLGGLTRDLWSYQVVRLRLEVWRPEIPAFEVFQDAALLSGVRQHVDLGAKI